MQLRSSQKVRVVKEEKGKLSHLSRAIMFRHGDNKQLCGRKGLKWQRRLEKMSGKVQNVRKACPGLGYYPKVKENKQA